RGTGVRAAAGTGRRAGGGRLHRRGHPRALPRAGAARQGLLGRGPAARQGLLRTAARSGCRAGGAPPVSSPGRAAPVAIPRHPLRGRPGTGLRAAYRGVAGVATFRALSAAVAGRQQVELEYWTASRNEVNRWAVDPYHLTVIDNDWY